MNNIVTVDQIVNLIVAIATIIACFFAFKTKYRGFALIIFVIAVINIVFYNVVIFTNLNEAYTRIFAIISGVRSFITSGLLLGMVIAFRRLDDE